MKNAIFLALKRSGDIFTYAPVINSFKKENPNVAITMLVYDEFSKAAKCISNVDEIITIKRKEIITYYKSKLFRGS